MDVVKPDDVEVLQRRPYLTLTLITCYPFYFAGSAPERFVVRASLVRKVANVPHSHIGRLELPRSPTGAAF